MELSTRMIRPEGGECTQDIYERVSRVFRFCANVSILNELPGELTVNSKSQADHEIYSKDPNDTFGWVLEFNSIEELKHLCSQDFASFETLHLDLLPLVETVTEIQALNMIKK